MERVFITPSYKNIEVLYAIANHKEFCRRVKEIVWDDARFEKYVTSDEEVPYGIYSERPLLNLDKFKLEWGYPTENDYLMSLDEDCAFYRRLHEEQQAIIEASLDRETLRKALSVFPALKRVTPGVGILKTDFGEEYIL
ncbi:hypothetical protein F5884DRAFT_751026 [Xylogone sp. PMI_703]|nr:hypothetical protein F5884DRAFT_751026 [Xylogone sp. PMI_703]